MANPIPDDFLEGVFCGSEEETRALARRLVPMAGERLVLSLEGPLGAGKTCFVQGLADGAGIDRSQVASPTFPLVHEYEGGSSPFTHLDLYRLESAEELIPLGFDEYVDAPGICAIEWGDRFPEALPRGTWRIRISVQPTGRLVTASLHP